MNTLWLSPVFDSAKGEPGPFGGVNVKLDATGTGPSPAPALRRPTNDGRPPSGYYARNYFAIDPMFGTLQDYVALVQTAHAHNLAVLMDVAIGHNKGSVAPSPSGRRMADAPDFSVDDMIEFLHELLVYWVRTANVDGYRLDQAYQVRAAHPHPPARPNACPVAGRSPHPSGIR